MSGIGFNGEHGPQTSLRPEGGQGQTHPRVLADLNCKDTETALQSDLSGPAADVPDRVVNSYRKASPP